MGKITIIEPGEKFQVASDSGNIYTISYAGSGDGDPEYVALWECSCPGYRYKGNCKHITAFLNSQIMDHGDPYYENDEIPDEINI